MGYFLGYDITKHNFLYLQQVLDKTSKNYPLKTKEGTQVIEYTNTLKQLKEAIPDTTEVLNIVKPDGKFAKIFSGLKWTQIDKSQFTSKTSNLNSIETEKQELCSLEIMKTINSGKSFNIDRLYTIYPELKNNQSWKDSFKAQYETMSKINSANQFKSFNRNGEFMDFISKLVRDKFGISRKDTWNPADIWLLKNEYMSDFDLLYHLYSSKTIEELNARLRVYFNSNDIVGISLKKTGNSAYYDKINLDFAEELESYRLESVRFPTQMTEGLSDFKQKSSIMFLDNNIHAAVRSNTSKWDNSNIYEFKKSNSKAQFGKVPLKMLETLNKNYGMNSVSTWRDIPRSAEVFNQYQWKLIYSELYHSRYFSGLDTPDNFSRELNKLYSGIDGEVPVNTSSILQAMLFYSNCIQHKDIDSYITEMCLLSQKIGPQFGPFGKLH